MKEKYTLQSVTHTFFALWGSKHDSHAVNAAQNPIQVTSHKYVVSVTWPSTRQHDVHSQVSARHASELITTNNSPRACAHFFTPRILQQ